MSTRKIFFSLEACKNEILNKLKEAGAAGLGKSKLIGNSAAEKAVLSELETKGLVINLGKGRVTRYVLPEFNKPLPDPLEIACEHIEKKASSVKAGLFTGKELAAGCKGDAKKKADEAIRWLIGEKKLLQLKRGKTVYFLHVSAIQDVLLTPQSVSEEKKEFSGLNREQVLAAYRKVRQRIGFSDVEIYELQQESGCDTDSLKNFLLEESREDRAVLSFGDWSLSSEETRSAAIHIRGKTYLLVRFKE